MTRVAHLLRLLAWVVFLSAVIVGLQRVGGRLAPPPLTDAAQLGRWVEQREPAETVMALLRLLTLGTAWYLLAATAVASVARLSGNRRLVTAANAVSVPLVRRLAGGALGLSIITTSVTGAAWAAPPQSSTTSTTLAPTMRRLPEVPPEPPAVEEEGVPDPPAAARWEVKPGEHFWAVATAVLSEAWRRAPTDREVDPYWRALVETNRSLLRDRDNPDLLFPGQVLTVPPPPQPQDPAP